MIEPADRFEYDHCGTTLSYGRDRVLEMSALLAEHGLERALIVCGSTTGSTDAVMEPVREGLRERLVSVFDEASAKKSVETVYGGIKAMREHRADVIVGIGGGSSLDVARLMSVLDADGRTIEDVYDTLESAGTIRITHVEDGAIPVVAVPTTFVGACLSGGGSLEAPNLVSSAYPPRVKLSAHNARPIAVVYDPALFETTPTEILAGSAMNGFNKGLETIYAPGGTPITDATAASGLRQMCDGFLEIRSGDPVAFERAVIGLALVQFERRTSLIHAFGHGFSRRYPIQQGLVHAVVTPHVLRYVFDHVDGRRALLADAIGLSDSGLSSDAAVIEAFETVRDELRLPSRLRELDGVCRDDLSSIATFISQDDPMAFVPEGIAPTASDIEAILRTAY